MIMRSMVEHLMRQMRHYFRNAITAWLMSPPQGADRGGKRRAGKPQRRPAKMTTRWPFEAFVQNKERAPAGGHSDRGSRERRPNDVQAISSGPLPSSLLSRAFVWATWAHTAAQKRCSSDLSDETLCHWNDRFTLVEGNP